MLNRDAEYPTGAKAMVVDSDTKCCGHPQRDNYRAEDSQTVWLRGVGKT
jgi:hypothetical protein